MTVRTRSRKFRALSLLTAFALAGCGLLPQVDPPTTTGRSGEVTVPVMLVAGSEGRIGSLRVIASPRTDGQLMVAISGDEVAGVQSMFEGAIWVATTLATLVTGNNLSQDFRFEYKGLVDGPSAGGVTTVAVLSLILGDEILPNVAMTGTITPTGTIGLVGGIPEKVTALAASDVYTKALIPPGTSMSPNTRGEVVDVVAIGAAGGLEVVEVRDITEAYLHMTGTPMPTPTSIDIPTQTAASVGKLQDGLRQQYAEFQAAEARFLALMPNIREIGNEIYLDARRSLQKASDLWDRGHYGGALVGMINANGIMGATADTFELLQRSLVEGTNLVATRFEEVGQIERKYGAYLEELGAYQVENLADAEALITSYGSSFDGYTMLWYASQQYGTLRQAAAEGQFATELDFVSKAVIPLLFLEVAEAQLGMSELIFEVGTGLDAPAIDPEADLPAIAAFFSRAAEANLNALEANVVAQIAEQRGEPVEKTWQLLTERDLLVMLSRSSRGVYQTFIAPNFSAENPNSAYAQMGYAWQNFTRNTGLVEKYEHNGVLRGEDMALIDVRSQEALTHSLDFSRSQLALSLEPLVAHGYSPALLIAVFESAGYDRDSSSLDDRFTAIEDSNGAFAMARILAYLGGFPTEGFRTIK